MQDPWNPTLEEIESGARTADAEPEQNWELVIVLVENIWPLLVRLESDPTCVNRDSILSFPYVYAGEKLSFRAPGAEVDDFRRTIELAMNTGSDDVKSWARRAERAAADDEHPPIQSNKRGGIDETSRHHQLYEFWFNSGWRNRDARDLLNREDER